MERDRKILQGFLRLFWKVTLPAPGNGHNNRYVPVYGKTTSGMVPGEGDGAGHPEDSFISYGFIKNGEVVFVVGVGVNRIHDSWVQVIHQDRVGFIFLESPRDWERLFARVESSSSSEETTE